MLSLLCIGIFEDENFSVFHIEFFVCVFYCVGALISTVVIDFALENNWLTAAIHIFALFFLLIYKLDWIGALLSNIISVIEVFGRYAYELRENFSSYFLQLCTPLISKRAVIVRGHRCWFYYPLASWHSRYRM